MIVYDTNIFYHTYVLLFLISVYPLHHITFSGQKLFFFLIFFFINKIIKDYVTYFFFNNSVI